MRSELKTHFDYASMVEAVDTRDLKFLALKSVSVRVRLLAPFVKEPKCQILINFPKIKL